MDGKTKMNTTAISTNSWFKNVNMTAERIAAHDAFEMYEEGLGPHGMQVLLQMGDNDSRLTQNDIEWFTSGIDKPVMAERTEAEPYWCLTEFGQHVYQLINAGNWVEVIRLTTDKDFT